MIKLKPIKHDVKSKLWCGMGALSAVTGLPSSETKKIFQSFRRCTYVNVYNEYGDCVGDKERAPVIKGISHPEMEKAFNLCGYNCALKEGYSSVPMKERPTLASYLRGRKFKQSCYLICVTNHYVVVKGNSFIDNHTRKPVPLSKAPWRRKRVKKVWLITEK